MEEKLRSLLYEGSRLQPVFNPMEAPKELPDPLVIDLTRDVTNYTRLYHTETDTIRELLAKADAVVTDTEKQAAVIRQFTSALTIVCPFGFTTAKDLDNELTIGILNYTDEQEMANKTNRKLLKGLNESFLVFGQPLDFENEGEVIEDDFDQFAGRCDVLVLPGTRHIIPSLTMPLSAMMAGTVVLTTNEYHALNVAAGVFILPTTRKVKPWKNYLKNFEKNIRQLESLKQFNTKYAKRVNSESLALISRLSQRLSAKMAA
jgi:hypothetical protein